MGKVRELSIVTYLSLDEVRDILEFKETQIFSYAYILHNKDYYSEDTYNKSTGELVGVKGQKKVDHIHIYLKTNVSRVPEEVVKWFSKSLDNKSKCNVQYRLVKNAKSLIEYMTHKNCPDKAQYLDSELFTYNIGEIENDTGCKDDSYFILEDLLNGMKLMELVRLYGRDFVYHYSSYLALVKDINTERKKDYYNGLENKINNKLGSSLKVEDELDGLPF